MKLFTFVAVPNYKKAKTEKTKKTKKKFRIIIFGWKIKAIAPPPRNTLFISNEIKIVTIVRQIANSAPNHLSIN